MIVQIHNNKESVDNGLYDSDYAKEDSNNDSDADDLNYPDDDPTNDDPYYRNPEEEQNPKLRAIPSVQRSKKGEKRKLKKNEKKINQRSLKRYCITKSFF